MQNEDPRLTAYALGELEPPERAEVEALLQNDPAAAQEVAEMRELAALVRRHLSTEEAPPPAPQQRDDILSEMSEPRVVVIPRNQSAASRRRPWIPVAIAACAAVLAGSSVLFYEEHKPREIVTMEKETDAPSPAPTGSHAPADEPQSVFFSDEKAEKQSVLESAPNASEAPRPTAARPFAASALPADERSNAGAVDAQSASALRSAQQSDGKREAVFSALPAPIAPSAPAPVAAPALGLATTAEAPALPAEFAKGTKPAAKLQDAPVADPARKDARQIDRLAGVTFSGAASAGQLQNSNADKAKSQEANTSMANATKAMPGAAQLGLNPVPARDAALKKAGESTLAAKPADLAGLAGGAGTPPAPRAASAQPSPDSHAAGGRNLALWQTNNAWNQPVRRLGETSTASPVYPTGNGAPAGVPTAKRQLVLNEEKQRGRAKAPGAPEAEQLPKQEVAAAKQPLFENNGGLVGGKEAEGRSDQLSRFAIDADSAEPFAANTLTTDSYDSVIENPFLQVLVRGNETSTFSIDVDTASYSNVRRFLTAGQRPPKGAVRIEELVNYFKYDYPEPKAGDPMSVNMDVSGCPWTPEHRLLRVGLKARELDQETRPQMNLIFLLDVSGSMQPEDRLPLIQKSLGLLVEKLGTNDTVGIVVYAGDSGVALEPTNDKDKMLHVIKKLSAGGSTNGGEGIQLAYKLAAKRFKKGAINRVILATDGDFNVGVTNQSDLIELIKKKAESGVFLTILGVGHGNLKDSTMEKLADQGNGNYAYIDTLAEGRKVLVEQMAGTLVTLAKDVKVQIEFNPAQVAAYRLIGYEKRLLAKEDFNDDTKDAGDIGAGHTVTALYEIVPAGQPIPGERETTQVDPLKYQPAPGLAAGNRVASATVDAPRYNLGSGKGAAVDLGDVTVPVNELLTLKLAWKAPDGAVSTKREFPLTDAGLTLEKSAKDFRWAAAVAEFGMLLRDSPYKGQATWSGVRELAVQGQGKDADSHRIEFLELLGKAEAVVAGK